MDLKVNPRLKFCHILFKVCRNFLCVWHQSLQSIYLSSLSKDLSVEVVKAPVHSVLIPTVSNSLHLWLVLIYCSTYKICQMCR
jgi:hypothetical protein